MAIVSYENRYIYLLNPRTASTATAQALRKYSKAFFVPKEDMIDKEGKVAVPRKHTTLRQLAHHNLLSEENLAEFFKFVTVRNPYDSIVSAWSKKVHDYAHLLDDPDSWVHRNRNYADGLRLAVDSTFSEWVVAHYAPFLERGRGPSINRKYIQGVDEVLYFETLADDFARVLPKLGIGSDCELPVSNVTKGRTEKNYRPFYTDEAHDIVSKLFKEEIDALGYTF